MKQLKFSHKAAQLINSGDKRSTFRMFDDKDISVNDEIEIIDKVDPNRPSTWRPICIVKVNSVIQKRLSNIDSDDLTKYDIYPTFDKLLHAMKIYYGNRFNAESTIKIISFSPHLNKGDLATDVDKKSTITKSLNLYTDGGSRGNPGPSACGFAIFSDDDKLIVKKGIYIGVTTNNQAEYQALKYGLEEAQKMHADIVNVYMDSMLVVNQMKGIFKVKNRDLWPVHDSVLSIMETFDRISFTQIPRKLNKIADSIVNDVLDNEANTQAL